MAQPIKRVNCCIKTFNSIIGITTIATKIFFCYLLPGILAVATYFGMQYLAISYLQLSEPLSHGISIFIIFVIVPLVIAAIYYFVRRNK